jgi:hypothetical protein
MDTLPLAVRSTVTLAAVSGWAGPRLKAMPPALVFSFAQLALGVVSFLGYVLAVGLPLLLQKWQVQQQTQPASTQQGSKADTGHTAGKKGAASAGSVAGKGGVVASRWGQMEREVLSTTAIFSVQAVSDVHLGAKRPGQPAQSTCAAASNDSVGKSWSW